MKAEKPMTDDELLDHSKGGLIVLIREIEQALAESEARIKRVEENFWYLQNKITEKNKQLGEVSKLFNGMKASHDALARKLIGKDDHIEQLQIAYKQLSDSDMERINEKDKLIESLKKDLDEQLTYTRNAYQLGRKDAQGDGLTENDKLIEAAYVRGFREGREEAEAEKDKEIAPLLQARDGWKKNCEVNQKEIEALKLELAAVQEGQIKHYVDMQVNQALSELREIEKGCAGHVDYEHKLALRVREFLKKNGMGD